MASREFHGIIFNQWNSSLFWSDDNVDGGEWTDDWYPSKVPGAGKIDPGQHEEWRSESDGILTGTSGWARWGVRVLDANDPEPDHFEWVQVNWSLAYLNGGHLSDCTFGVTRTDPKTTDAFAKPDTRAPVLEIIPARRNPDGSAVPFQTDGAGKTEELIGLALLPLGYFVFTDLINGNLEHASVDFIVRERAVARQTSTVAPPTRGIIYAVDHVRPAKIQSVGGSSHSFGGNLKWFHHLGIDDGSFAWQGPKVVGVGWGGFKQLFGGGAGVIYGISPVIPASGATGIEPGAHGHPASGGDLVWYRHTGREDGAFSWKGPLVVGKGWGGLHNVFADGDGFVYGVTPTVLATPPVNRQVGESLHDASGGDLMWYHHLGRDDGSFRWEGPRKVGTGWGSLKQIFAGGGGIIYAVTSDGDLMWYRHLGRGDGTFRWDGPKKVGIGWGQMKQVFSAGNGVLYAVTEQNDLLWYHHDGFADGSFRWAPASGSKVGVGWDVAAIFAD